MQVEAQHKVELVNDHTQKLEDDLKRLGLTIKHREENLKNLKTQISKLDESILEMQVKLGNYYHSSSISDGGSQILNHIQAEETTVEQILRQEKTAAGMLCQLKLRHGARASHLPLTKDILGIVATLGKVHDDNLSRLLSEYLGLEKMLAIVCKSSESIRAIEMHHRDGRIDENAGLHGLGPSIGRPIDGRFLVICLENLRTYAGEFVARDPQKKLAFLKPRLPNGECPSGFLGFAVNMIHVDSVNLSGLTTSGHGLRETLFYSLFSRLQVYRTRVDMQLAVPCISDGAVSLDGGMMMSDGVYSLGNRKDVEVRFSISSRLSNLPEGIIQTEDQLNLLSWEKERIVEDVKREEGLLQNAKINFEFKMEEFLKFLCECPPNSTQAMLSPGGTRSEHPELQDMPRVTSLPD